MHLLFFILVGNIGKVIGSVIRSKCEFCCYGPLVHILTSGVVIIGCILAEDFLLIDCSQSAVVHYAWRFVIVSYVNLTCIVVEKNHSIAMKMG